MIYVIENLLLPEELDRFRALYEDLPLRDGGESTGQDLHQIKNNQEIVLGDRLQWVKDTILAACNRAPMLNLALLPKKVSTPIVSRYGPGMRYGDHMDSAIGQDDDRVYRVDMSCTIFLDEPDAYEGGELEIDTDFGTQRYKLGAGDAIFYPTIFIHRVMPVHSGERRVCIFWMESLVRDPGKRALLLELAQISSWLSEREPMDSEARQRLVKVRENLYRMWLEP